MTSPKLSLPLLQPNQAQKHVTVNESLMTLDLLVQPTVLSVSVDTPPASPDEGDTYLIGATPSGAWSGQSGSIVTWRDGAWAFAAPQAGWQVHETSTGKDWRYDGSDWSDTPAAPLALPGLAINTATDPANPLSVRADSTLFTTETGDHRIHLNRTAATNTASLVLETGFAANAEIGLAGGEDLEIKVRDSGGTWRQAMQISRETAAIQARAVFSGEVDIPDDGAASIQTPWAGGLFAFASIDDVYPQAAHSGLVSYDTGATLALVTLAAGPSVENAGAVPLTGTTGTDGKTTLSAQAGALQIENRFGSGRRFRFTFLC